MTRGDQGSGRGWSHSGERWKTDSERLRFANGEGGISHDGRVFSLGSRLYAFTSSRRCDRRFNGKRECEQPFLAGVGAVHDGGNPPLAHHRDAICDAENFREFA